MKKHFFLILILTITACTNTPGEKPHAPKIAALLKTSTNPYFHLMWEGIKREADIQGIDVQIFWPENESDFEYQYDFLKNKATQFDALILSPSDVDEVGQYLKPLKTHKLPIVILDAGINIPPNSESHDYYDAFLGTDNEKGGELAADFLIPRLHNKPNIIVIGGFQKYMVVPGRTLSFKKRILATYPNALISEFIGNYDREHARSIVRANIKTFMASDAVFCANDHMALGVIDILSSTTAKKTPIIVGYDSIKEAQEAILEGKLSATVAQFPARMGSEAVKVITSLLQNKTVPPQILIEPEISIQKPTIEVVKSSELRSHR